MGAWQEGDPVDVYTPHHSMIIKNGLGEKIEPTPLLPIPVKATYYPGAPDMLTSLDSLHHVYEDDPPLSSLRIVVSDVAKRSETSQKKIEAVATKISEQTGHRVEIMLGSSASKVHVNLAGTESDEAGTVEEGWQQKGVSWSIEDQINQTNILLFIYLLIISVIFCYTVITHSLINRSIDFAMLRAIGWARMKIVRILFIEVLTISLIPLLIIWIPDYWLKVISAKDYLFVWFITFFIIALGYLSGSYKALNHSPREGLEGEGSEWKLLRFVKIRGIISYCFHQLFRRPLRFGLLVIVIAMTTFMLLLSIATQQSLSEYLYLSFIGETIDLQLANYQTAILIMSFVLAIGITFLLLFLNITERKKEIFIFRSIGWPMRRIQFYTNLESFIVAVTGAVLGTLGGSMFISMYTDVAIPGWLIILTILGPVMLIILFTIVIVGGFRVKPVKKNDVM